VNAAIKELLIFLVLAITLITTESSWATSQEPDLFILDGEKVKVVINPIPSLPEETIRSLPKPNALKTSNWRGYVATWEARDDQFLLTNISIRINSEITYSGSRKDVYANFLDKIFPGAEHINASWYSGTVFVSQGNKIEEISNKYSNFYERYIVLRIKNGRVIERINFSGEEFKVFRSEKFKLYKNTEKYAERLKEVRVNLSEKSAEEFLYEYEFENYMPAEP
jgi:hypothetical protein